ncbi:hypothetical protein [Klebsiella quasivariicola]|uniref:hypothetical protein n=1 Tax=Klebsiella quasivariicola TaxID=2026240 RepID=UPI00247AAD0C|nr:hypothetical protein [Klebsiella quasivariicola]
MADILILVLAIALWGISSLCSNPKEKPKSKDWHKRQLEALERERIAKERFRQRQGSRTPRPTLDPAEHNSRFLSEQKRRNEEYTKKLIEQTEADIKASEKFFLED